MVMKTYGNCHVSVECKENKNYSIVCPLPLLEVAHKLIMSPARVFGIDLMGPYWNIRRKSFVLT